MRINKTHVLWLLVLLLAFLLLSPALSAESEPELDGKQIYGRFCSTCHESSYAKDGMWYPPLKNIVTNSEPEDLIHIIDHGQFRRAGETTAGSHPSHTIPFMPAWSWLSDAELAALVNFLVDEFTDGSVSVSEAEVRAQRNPGMSTSLSTFEREAAHQLYLSHCAGCHGTAREGVVGPPLSKWPLETLSMEQIRAVLHYGTLDGMPEWGVSVRLTAQQMTMLARYLQEPPVLQTPVFDLDAMRASWQKSETMLGARNLDSQYLFTLLHDARKALFINPEKHTIVAETRLDYAPYDVLQDHEIWVLSREGWVMQIDPATKKVRTQ